MHVSGLKLNEKNAVQVAALQSLKQGFIHFWMVHYINLDHNSTMISSELKQSAVKEFMTFIGLLPNCMSTKTRK